MQLQVPTWRRTLLIIKKTVKKQLYFDDFHAFQTFHPPPVFRPLTSRITIFLLAFDSGELKIPQGFQKCIVLWVCEQHLKSY